MANYKIYTDSAADIPTDIRKKFGIEYFPMGITKDGGPEMKADMDWKIYSPKEFYGWIRDGHKLKTTQVSVETFYNLTKKEFEAGNDVIYLGCSTALTGSINSFNLAKEMLADEFKDRIMVATPTYAASVTLGMMVCDAARQQAKGLSLDELQKWVEDHRFFYNQFCTVDTLTYLKEAGRIKGAKAFIGNIMGVKPIFISDRLGNNFVIEKVRGTNSSLDALFNHIKEAIHKDEKNLVVIVHADVIERAEKLKDKFLNELDVKEVIITDLGPITGISCGPGAIAAFCYGEEVTRYEGDNLSND